MKRDHRLSALHRKFMEWKRARDGKCTLRTAQRHSRADSEEWRAFMLAQEGKGSSAPVVSGDVVVVMGEVAPLYDGEMTPEEAIENQHWMIYQNALQMIRVQMEAPNEQMVAVWSRVAMEAQKGYRDARKDRLDADVLNGKLVPVSEFEAYRLAVAQVALIVKNMGRELAAQVNPANPHEALAVFDRWYQTRWNPAIAELLEAA